MLKLCCVIRKSMVKDIKVYVNTEYSTKPYSGFLVVWDIIIFGMTAIHFLLLVVLFTMTKK